MDLTKSNGELSVGVKMLDCDHRALFEIINELQTAAASDSDPRRTSSLLHKLAEFTLTHFALEEGMMVATKYPEMDLHRLHHQRITEQVAALASRYNQDDNALDSQSLSVLSDLHADHVQQDDLHYGLWLNAIGVR
ncbi:MAG: bacteriohemerythrin [Terracidiphilus sp.]